MNPCRGRLSRDGKKNWDLPRVLELLEFLESEGFCIGKATAAPYPMSTHRLLTQAESRDPVKGGLDLYATRGVPFHIGGPVDRLRSLWRSIKEN